MNEYHAANENRWNRAAPQYAEKHDKKGTWRVAHQQPEVVFRERELELMGPVRNRDVCVLGSGDNLAVFALAGMGARVTSVDISREQLKVARQRSAELGLRVQYVKADVTNLSGLASAAFDLVYTGGHVAVWVADLRAYYREAIRILRPSGLLLINEYHPFRRIWKDQKTALEVGYSYFDHGPHQYNTSAELLSDRSAGDTVQYEFHWTVAQYLKAVIEQGVELIEFAELGDAAEGWEYAPLAGLPQMLLIAGRKRP